MKKLILLCIWVLMGTLVLEAQAPEKFSYQAVIRDVSNNLVVEQMVGFQISIRHKTAMGSIVYQETHTAMTNINGLVSLEVGDGMTVDNFSDIDWGDGPYFIQTEIDPTGDTDFSIVGMTELISVPYALYAGNVKKYNVGDFAQGGIVFYVEPCGTRGLVAAETDQSTGIRWYGGTNGNTQAKGDGPYAGIANTSIIIAAHVSIGDDGDPYAARICNELEITQDGITYGDWYLPSIAELELMYLNINSIGNFSNGFFWSSSEYTANFARYFNFSNGLDGNDLKSLSFPVRVRAVRAF